MDNIILQHFDGKLPDWAKVAKKTVERYALEIGVDYEHVVGTPCGKEQGPYTQKMHMLNEKYDDYDQVLMLDMDVAATKTYENIFDIPQIGVLHDRAMKSASNVKNRWENNKLYKQGHHVFFGSVIKLTKDMRKELRKFINWSYFNECINYNYGSDELVLHYLFWNTGLLKDKSYYEICMRRDGVNLSDIHVRNYDRFDRKFANQPEDSEKNASLIHFCAHRKNFLIPYMKKIHENI
jgi:hypothetical protein